MKNSRAETVLDVIRSRRSNRRLSPEPLAEEDIDLILEAARWAPSSCNMQQLGLIRIVDPEIRRRLVEDGRCHGVVGYAPLVFLVTYEKELSQEYDSNIQSGAAAIQNMLLMATALGLGSFWAATVGREKIVRSILNIPERRAILAFASFGKPLVELIVPRRREVEEFLHIDRYDESKDITLSGDPEDWDLNKLKTFQELRLRSGAKYVPYMNEEFAAVIDNLAENLTTTLHTWLDLLPGTGAYTQGLVDRFSNTDFTISDIAEQMMIFTEKRVSRPVQKVLYEEGKDLGSFDVVSCLFRLEAYPKNFQKEIIKSATKSLAPGGTLVVAVVDNRSFFWPLYLMKKAIKKEFRFPTMTPNMIAPFKPVDADSVQKEVISQGLTLKKCESLFFLPTSEELSTFYSKNKSWKRPFIQAFEGLLSAVPKPWKDRRSKIQILYFKRAE